MMKHKFNDLGSIKSNLVTLNMRLNNNAVPLDSKHWVLALLFNLILSVYKLNVYFVIDLVLS